MAERITEGSLVCAKRNVGGLGIVLRRIKDINLYAEFDLSEAFIKLYDSSHPEYMFGRLGSSDRSITYTLKLDTIDSISDMVVQRKPEIDRTALDAFWSHNRAYSDVVTPKKSKKRTLNPKVDFCLIHWTRPPSDYGDTPAPWYAKGHPIWMVTTSIKNK